MPDLPELADVSIEIVPGDLSDDEALRRLCAGADAIIHVAGLVKAPSRDDFMFANADGAAAVARSWRNVAPGARFMLVSSLAAREPGLSYYAESKRAGEDRVREIAGSGDWIVIRPAAIYGEYDRESLKILKLSNAPFQLMLNDASARIAMIDVRDAAEAMASLIETEARGQIYELADERPEGHSWRELAETAAQALGRSPRPARLPAAVLKTVAALGDIASSITGSAEMLTSAKVREILHDDWSVDPTHIPPADVWSARIPLSEGLADMAAWARAEGAL